MKIKDNLVFKPNKRNCISSLLVFFDQFWFWLCGIIVTRQSKQNSQTWESKQTRQTKHLNKTRQIKQTLQTRQINQSRQCRQTTQIVLNV